MIRIILIAGLTAVIGITVFLLTNQSNTPPVSQKIPGQKPTIIPSITLTPTPTSNAIQEVTIIGSSMKFDVTTIQAKKGTPIKLHFRSLEGRHNFVLDEFNVKTNILGSGGEEIIEFVADKTGTFEYYCSVPGHRTMGMKGTLVIE